MANPCFAFGQHITASMQMVGAVGAFLDENADKLTPEQEQFAAVFLMTYPGLRAVSMWGLIEKCKRAGIHLYYSKAKAGKGWRVKFK